MYVDETGNLDYGAPGKSGATTYFGFGTATYAGHHGDALFEGMRLRATLDAAGTQLPKGFHAVDDRFAIKTAVYALLKAQSPRFDTTFLLKANALPYVRAAGAVRLYKLAWYLHFKQIALQIATPNDHLYVIAATFATARRAAAFRQALTDVCNQVQRQVTLCIWNSQTSWGLQGADYGLWATQRHLEKGQCHWFDQCVQPTLSSKFMPWGQK